MELRIEHRRRDHRRCRDTPEDDQIFRADFCCFQSLEQLANSSLNVDLGSQPWRPGDGSLWSSRHIDHVRCCRPIPFGDGGSISYRWRSVPLDSDFGTESHEPWPSEFCAFCDYFSLIYLQGIRLRGHQYNWSGCYDREYRYNCFPIFLAMIAFNVPSFTIQHWRTFLLYQVLNLISLLYNLFALRRAPWTHSIGAVVSFASFLIISITCLAIAEPKKPSDYVWQEFTNNNTGWSPDALVFLIGLINPTYGFGGLDGAIHLAEDCFDPARTVPRAICYSLGVGFITAFFFTVSMLYCIKDIQEALNSRTGSVTY